MNDGKIKKIDKKVENPEQDVYKILKDSKYAEIKIAVVNGKNIVSEHIIKDKKFSQK